MFDYLQSDSKSTYQFNVDSTNESDTESNYELDNTFKVRSTFGEKPLLKLVSLKKFNMDMIDFNQNLLSIARRNRGKSTLIQDYLYKRRNFKHGLVISPTDAYNHIYYPHMSTSVIYDEYTPTLIANFRHQQKVNCSNNKSNVNGLIILDDCLNYYSTDISRDSWIYDKNLKKIIIYGQIQTTLLVTMQHSGIPQCLRHNFDWVFIGSDHTITEQKRLYKHYGGMFPTFAMFQSVLKHCTRDFGHLVIHNSSTSDKLEDQIYWYRVDMNKPDWSNFRVIFDNVRN